MYLADIDRHLNLFLQFFLFGSSYCNIFNNLEMLYNSNMRNMGSL